MSRTRTIAGLAIAFLIASAFFVAAQDTRKTIELANYPGLAGDAGPQIAALAPHLTWSAAAGGVTGPQAVSGAAPLLAENAYDFNNIDGIPGFATLPPGYDSAAVMPQIGSQ